MRRRGVGWGGSTTVVLSLDATHACGNRTWWGERGAAVGQRWEPRAAAAVSATATAAAATLAAALPV